MVELETVYSLHIWQGGWGVRQGCSLSPLLYFICDEAMIKKSMVNLETGISLGGHIINTIN